MIKQVQLSDVCLGDVDVEFMVGLLCDKRDLSRPVEVRRDVLEHESVDEIMASIDTMVMDSLG